MNLLGNNIFINLIRLNFLSKSMSAVLNVQLTYNTMLHCSGGTGCDKQFPGQIVFFLCFLCVAFYSVFFVGCTLYCDAMYTVMRCHVHRTCATVKGTTCTFGIVLL